MKKYLIGLALALSATAVYASCVTNTVYANGKMTICTTCCTGTFCNTTCY